MLKTYSREELKQLEGKRVRCKFTYPQNDFVITWMLIVNHNNFHIWAWAHCIKNEYNSLGRIYQFELLENEFEVGEEVEVSDDRIKRVPKTYLSTIPWTSYNPYILVMWGDEDKYRKGEDFAWTSYQQIRKKPKPEPKKMTMEELNKELWYEVEIVEKK